MFHKTQNTKHKAQSTKLVLKFMVVFFFSLYYGCQKEQDLENVTNQTEVGEIEYGITKDQLFNSIGFDAIVKNSRDGLTVSRTNSAAASLTPEDLLQRLDLDGAYLSVNNSKEILQIPVRVQGDYKRILMTLTEEGFTNSFFLTYPDATNNNLFYVSTLDGVLLQKTTIGDDGIGVNELYNNPPSTTSRESNTCYGSIVYTSCSSTDHSFELGNADECSYWSPSSTGGYPPSYTLIEVQCTPTGSGPSGSGSSGPGSSGGTSGGGTNNGGFSGAPPRKGGNSLVDADDCVSNVDCNQCNLGALDINSDCDLDDIEVIVNQINNCFTNSSATPNGLSNDQRNILYNDPDLAIGAFNALTITCDSDEKEFLLGVLEEYEFGDEVDFQNKIIKDSSFIGTKEDCVLNELISSNNKFIQTVE